MDELKRLRDLQQERSVYASRNAGAMADKRTKRARDRSARERKAREDQE